MQTVYSPSDIALAEELLSKEGPLTVADILPAFSVIRERTVKDIPGKITLVEFNEAFYRPFQVDDLVTTIIVRVRADVNDVRARMFDKHKLEEAADVLTKNHKRDLAKQLMTIARRWDEEDMINQSHAPRLGQPDI